MAAPAVTSPACVTIEDAIRLPLEMTDELITGHPTPELPELRRLIFSIAYRMLGSIAEAEDIVQEAFLRLYHAVPYLVVAVPTCLYAKCAYGYCALLSCPILGATAANRAQLSRQV